MAQEPCSLEMSVCFQPWVMCSSGSSSIRGAISWTALYRFFSFKLVLVLLLTTKLLAPLSSCAKIHSWSVVPVKNLLVLHCLLFASFDAPTCTKDGEEVFSLFYLFMLFVNVQSSAMHFVSHHFPDCTDSACFIIPHFKALLYLL